MHDGQSQDARFARLADLVVDVAREVRLRSDIDAPGVPLNQTQSQVMRFVHRHPGCSATDIAAGAGLKRANLSPAIAELRDLGYLDTRRSDTDARVIRLHPTALAESTIGDLTMAWSRLLAEAWDAAPRADADVAAAEEVLERLLAGLATTRD